MQAINRKKTGLAAGAAGLLVLAACGGGGGGSSDNGGSSAPTLASAAGSVEGLLAYMKVAVSTTSDTTEPIDVTTFVAPTSDTTEPDPSV
jgi:hypothetical protein